MSEEKELPECVMTYVRDREKECIANGVDPDIAKRAIMHFYSYLINAGWKSPEETRKELVELCNKIAKIFSSYIKEDWAREYTLDLESYMNKSIAEAYAEINVPETRQEKTSLASQEAAKHSKLVGQDTTTR